MAWRDRLQNASFRGAAFKVEETTTEVGRRSEEHQFPFSKIPYFEDLGLEAGVYIVRGYVIQSSKNGFDYFGERDALISALKQEGPGTLIHPFLGTLQVGVMGTAKIEESFREGGMARFFMTFVDAGEQQQATLLGALTRGVDQTSFADTVSDTLLDTANSQFVEKYDPSGPGFITGEREGAYGKAKNFIRKVHSTLLGVQATTVGVISKAQTAIRVIQNEIEFVVGFPQEFADAIQNTTDTYWKLRPGTKNSYYSAITAQGTTSTSTRTSSAQRVASPISTATANNILMDKKNPSVAKAAINLTSYGDNFESIPSTTPERLQQLNNQNAIIDIVRASAIAEAVRCAVYTDYNSYEDAMNMLLEIINAIDIVLIHIGENSQNDIIFNAIKEIKPFIVQSMLIKGASLPIMKSYEIGWEINPSLLIAYRLYDDLNREQEIIDNNIQYMEHPGFPSGGATLKVYSE